MSYRPSGLPSQGNGRRLGTFGLTSTVTALVNAPAVDPDPLAFNCKISPSDLNIRGYSRPVAVQGGVRGINVRKWE